VRRGLRETREVRGLVHAHELGVVGEAGREPDERLAAGRDGRADGRQAFRPLGVAVGADVLAVARILEHGHAGGGRHAKRGYLSDPLRGRERA
jgi:hypothetical protein